MAKYFSWTAGMSQEERDKFNAEWMASEKWREHFVSYLERRIAEIQAERLEPLSWDNKSVQDKCNAHEMILKNLIDWVSE